MIRSVEVREPEWTPDEVALLVASKMRASEYGPHGFLLSEATDPANAHAFVPAEKPLTDYAQKAYLDKQEAFYAEWEAKTGKPVNRNGLIWRAPKKK